MAPERLEAIPHARHCIACADSAPFSTGDRRRP
ncbi:MAG: TraR/DksA C4-type zinc finger protein [Actinomycetota bacterium]|nr:TraR/DksA C4-type zinc finger protein [Actinomycetota bacterium]